MLKHAIRPQSELSHFGIVNNHTKTTKTNNMKQMKIPKRKNEKQNDRAQAKAVVGANKFQAVLMSQEACAAYKNADLKLFLYYLGLGPCGAYRAPFGIL